MKLGPTIFSFSLITDHIPPCSQPPPLLPSNHTDLPVLGTTNPTASTSRSVVPGVLLTICFGTVNSHLSSSSQMYQVTPTPPKAGSGAAPLLCGMINLFFTAPSPVVILNLVTYLFKWLPYSALDYKTYEARNYVILPFFWFSPFAFWNIIFCSHFISHAWHIVGAQ